MHKDTQTQTQDATLLANTTHISKISIWSNLATDLALPRLLFLQQYHLHGQMRPDLQSQSSGLDLDRQQCVHHHEKENQQATSCSVVIATITFILT